VRRLGWILATLAAAVAAVPSTAAAAQIAQVSEAIGGGGTPKHANRFIRDGLASSCGEAFPSPPGSPETGPSQYEYKKHTFRSNVQEPVCVTVSLNTACTGANEVMSESYSPAYDPNSITANWIADLGNSPPAATSYSFTVAAGSQFETVIDERTDPAACTGVTTTWTSDRPWATGRPYIDGVPAIGQMLNGIDFWAESPAVERQWRRCDAAGANCSDIAGATAVTYTPTDADLGRTLTLRETATDGGGTSTAQAAATNTVFIPIQAIVNQSIAPGDPSQQGFFSTAGNVSSSCAAPKSAPGLADNSLHIYDSYGLTSLVNEPLCIRVQKPALDCAGVGLAAYIPSFNPAAITQNYVADDGVRGALGYTLAPGASAVHVITNGSIFNCLSYDLVIGSDGPFARSLPSISGATTEGQALAVANGDWTGQPLFGYEWRRCDAQGELCSPIAAAGAASYTPSADDVGRRLRVRVTAVQGQSASADSPPSAVIAAAAPAVPAGPGTPLAQGGVADRKRPTIALALARTTLQKVVKRGFLPVNVTCDEACTITLRADVTRKLGKRLGGVKIASGKGRGSAAKRTTVKVKLTRKARRALRRRNSLVFTLQATATDAAGNRAAASKKARLTRKR
jgi:hypothetical protein